MSIKDRTNIKLLNYNTSRIVVNADNKGYLFEGADDGVPTIHFFNWRDIEYINSTTHVLRTGELVFEDADKEEAYAALGINDWRDTVLLDSDIDEIFESPTVENLERIINIKFADTLERVRGRMARRISGGLGVDTRVRDAVNMRYHELREGKLKSSVTIKAYEPDIAAQEAIRLKESNDNLQKQIEELKAMLMPKATSDAESVKKPTAKKPTNKKTKK